MLVEHARNLCGIVDAAHAEYETPGTLIVTLLACSLRDSQIEVGFTPGTQLARLHDSSRALERTTCSYGLDPTFASIASQHAMVVGASDATGEVRAVERSDHPFFVATLYQPQLSSAIGNPHPIWKGFARAAQGR